MTILVVGAGKNGARVLRQLRRNPKLRILTLDPRENPYAIAAGLIDKVDFTEALTPLTLDVILKQARPDLVLLTSTSEDMGLGESAGIGMLADALRDELAMMADVPVIEVARSAAR